MFAVNIAVQIEAVSIGWQIYSIGRETLSIKESAFLVGMVGLAQFLPLFALTLWAGSLADRHSRRAIVLAARVDEMPHKDIAARYGVSARTVEKELRAGLEHCCERLGRDFIQRFGPGAGKQSKRDGS
eukprot:gene43540-58960_t